MVVRWTNKDGADGAGPPYTEAEEQDLLRAASPAAPGRYFVLLSPAKR